MTFNFSDHSVQRDADSGGLCRFLEESRQPQSLVQSPLLDQQRLHLRRRALETAFRRPAGGQPRGRSSSPWRALMSPCSIILMISFFSTDSFFHLVRPENYLFFIGLTKKCSNSLFVKFCFVLMFFSSPKLKNSSAATSLDLWMINGSEAIQVTLRPLLLNKTFQRP